MYEFNNETRLFVSTGVSKSGKDWYAIDIGTLDGFRKRIFLNKWQLKAFGLVGGKLYRVVEIDPEPVNE